MQGLGVRPAGIVRGKSVHHVVREVGAEIVGGEGNAQLFGHGCGVADAAGGCAVAQVQRCAHHLPMRAQQPQRAHAGVHAAAQPHQHPFSFIPVFLLHC